MTVNGGEVGDADYYDAAGALLFPSERMRRWVTPADINGTGHVYYVELEPDHGREPSGSTRSGRVEFNSYFRPPGSPGVINTSYTYTDSTGLATPNVTGTYLGAIYFPQPSNSPNSQFYGSGPNPSPAGITQTSPTVYPYLPDLTSNPLHGLEAGRFPNQTYYRGQRRHRSEHGGQPCRGDESELSGHGCAVSGCRYDERECAECDADVRLLRERAVSLGRPERRRRDESCTTRTRCMIHRSGRATWNGCTGSRTWTERRCRAVSRSLRRSSFTNGFDGARRRRLFALDSWDLNSFRWTNDNPVQPTFVLNAAGNLTQVLAPFPDEQPVHGEYERGISDGLRGDGLRGTTAGLGITGIAGLETPGLAQRDKKINLNYPLPVSNDSNEPVRQKWINDAYQLLKSILPPKAVDTPEELAQLSQYVINIVDFRDPDSTMTHWQNPDVAIFGVPVDDDGDRTRWRCPPTAVTLVSSNAIRRLPTNLVPLRPVGHGVQSGGDQRGAGVFVLVQQRRRGHRRAGQPVLHGAGEHADFAGDLVWRRTAGFNPALNLGGYVYNTPRGHDAARRRSVSGRHVGHHLHGRRSLQPAGPVSRPACIPTRICMRRRRWRSRRSARRRRGLRPRTRITRSIRRRERRRARRRTAMTLCCSRWAITRRLLRGRMRRAGRQPTLQAGQPGYRIRFAAGPTTALATGGTAPLPINYFYVIGNAATTTAGTAGTRTSSTGPARWYWPRPRRRRRAPLRNIDAGT